MGFYKMRYVRSPCEPVTFQVPISISSLVLKGYSKLTNLHSANFDLGRMEDLGPRVVEHGKSFQNEAKRCIVLFLCIAQYIAAPN